MDIREIIKAGGGVTKLAKAIGKHHTSVLGWTKTECRKVPLAAVPAVAEATGLSKEQIRPDVWGEAA